MIFVGKAPSGIPNIRHFDRSERIYDIISNTPGVGDLGILSNPDAAINAVAEMFGELAENVTVDLSSRFRGVDTQFNPL
jgi:hypothetical protein